MNLRFAPLALSTLGLLACSGGKEALDSGLDTGLDRGTDSGGESGETGETGEAGETGAPGGDTFTHEARVVNAERWTTGTHVVTQSFSVEGGILEIEPCSTIFMPPGATITVQAGGAIRAIGTPQCPITFLSAKGSPAAGDWAHIELHDSADGGSNAFEHVNVLYAGGAGDGAIWLGEGASLSMRASSVRESAGVGVALATGAELRNFQGNTLTHNADVGIALGANEADQLGEGVYGPNAVEGIRVRHDTVDHAATWRSLGEPWVAPEGFLVAAPSGDGTLTIAAGATLALGPDATVSVYAHGGLTLEGTAAEPVTVRSAKDAPAAGDWATIEIFAGSVGGGNRFTHARILHGGGAAHGQVWLDHTATLTLDHAAFTEAGGGCDLYVNEGSVLEATESSFTSCPR